MTFRSILFESANDAGNGETADAPAFFVDLNLDQIVDAITAGRQDYDLKPFFYTSLKDLDSIAYRHEVLRDLENPALFEALQSFAQKMRAMREHLAKAEKLYYRYQKERWFLDAVDIYGDAVFPLYHDLSGVELRSRGFLAFREYLAGYLDSDRLTSLRAHTRTLKADLSAVKYCLLIKGDSIRVRRYDSETDYSADVQETFEKFRQGAVKDYRLDFAEWPAMNHVEARVLDFVARLHPEIFSALDTYCARHRDYLDPTIAAFDREIQFYVAYLEYLAPLKRAGLHFCYPHLSATRKDIYNREGFDLALAHKLVRQQSSIVCNDFYLEGDERIFVVTGPNQGGKTTFARAFGQLHYLASLGCPVPGREARLWLFDRLFTHFEKQEDLADLRGKLEDDLVRIHAVLGQATSNSIIIMNEAFTSTTLTDAVFLGRKILGRIMRLDALCVCVTFVDELASLGERTVSVVSTVSPDNPALRTYTLVRKLADGLAYAISIADKHQLTHERVKARVRG